MYIYIDMYCSQVLNVLSMVMVSKACLPKLS